MQDIEIIRVKSKKKAHERMEELKYTNVDAQLNYKQLLVSTTNVIYRFKIEV